MCFGMNERGDIYSSGGGNMNEPRPHFSLSCNIHTMGEKTLGRGPKGGGKEELGEEE